MRTILLLPLLLTLTFAATAQQNVYAGNCLPEGYCKDCGETKAVYEGKLIKYFEKQLDWAIMSKMSGVVVVKILVASNGIPCAYAFYNHSTVDEQTIRDLHLDKIVNRMGKWTPAMQDGQPVNSSVLLAIYSKVKYHKMFEVDYLRNDKDKKWIVNGIDGKKPVTNFDDISDMTEQMR